MRQRSVRKPFCVATLAFLSLILVSSAHAQQTRSPVYLQVLLGAARFAGDDLNFQQSASSDATTTSENDLSSMPYGGIAVQYPFAGEHTVWGLDGSLLFGARNRNSTVVASSNQVSIRLKSELLLTDVAAGVYIASSSQHWRVYVAAGPAMVFGQYNDDVDEDDLTVSPALRKSSDDSESAFGIGGYVRGGIEYRLNPLDSIGICVRALQTNLEFDSAPDATSDLNGVQGFLSFSRYF
jgi:hypothetical protein